jgi:hypothetical protein
MGTASVPETLKNFRTLIWLCVQENFIEFWITFEKFLDQISVCRRVIFDILLWHISELTANVGVRCGTAG